ncbi:MAG: hypothetical protein HY719_07430 [Planctomycetes bacterium]|nr:hypothetical protein [Planctomycetota bacterium]
MPDKVSLFVVLVEDEEQQNLVRHYLSIMGIDARKTRYVAIPSGRGCGFRHVINRYPEQIRDCQRRHAKTHLVVMVDADVHTVDQRREELTAALESLEAKVKPADDLGIILIPRRNVETWIRCLNGEQVNEETDYGAKRAGRATCEQIKTAAGNVYTWSRQHAQVPTHCVDSLRNQLPEWRRIEP